MMKWLTLEMIKQNSRIDGDEEDELLIRKGEEAEDQVLGDINRTYQELIEWQGEVPKSIIEASLLLVDQAYQQRCAVSSIQLYPIAYSYVAKIRRYMRLADRDFYDETTGGYVIGSQFTVPVDVTLPDGVMLQDINFTVTVYNANRQDKKHEYTKEQCIATDNGYAVAVDSDELGVGNYMMKVACDVPDENFSGGTRKTVVRVNPNIKVIG